MIKRHLSTMTSSKMTVFLVHPKRKNELPHEALANMGDDPSSSKAFAARWSDLWEEEAAQGVVSVMGREELEAVYRILRDQLRSAWRGDTAALASLDNSFGFAFNFRWDSAGKTELIPKSLWTAIVVLFLRDHAAGRTAICANPNCASPYFIRKRSSQKFCESGPCVEYGARLRANLWWAKHGNAWREKKRKGAK